MIDWRNIGRQFRGKSMTSLPEEPSTEIGYMDMQAHLKNEGLKVQAEKDAQKRALDKRMASLPKQKSPDNFNSLNFSTLTTDGGRPSSWL